MTRKDVSDSLEKLGAGKAEIILLCQAMPLVIATVRDLGEKVPTPGPFFVKFLIRAGIKFAIETIIGALTDWTRTNCGKEVQ